MNVLNQLGSRLWAWLKRVGAIFWRALVKYDETDGEQRAASFAYYAFFALFPLIVVLVTIGTGFMGPPEHTEQAILEQVKNYLPTDPSLTALVANTLHGVLQSRKRAISIAFLVIAWSALRFFQSLVHGVNRAWGTKEYSWWRLPIKNLLMVVILASALLIGTLLPVVVDGMRDLYWDHSWEFGLDFKFMGPVFRFMRWLVAPLVLFYGFSMFYKYAPQRKTLLREVWSAALFTTVSLNGLQWLFSIYTKNVANFNVLYGTFGSVLVLLMWIYLSGSIIILGGCLSAARYEIDMHIENQAESNRAA